MYKDCLLFLFLFTTLQTSDFLSIHPTFLCLAVVSAKKQSVLRLLSILALKMMSLLQSPPMTSMSILFCVVIKLFSFHILYP